MARTLFALFVAVTLCVLDGGPVHALPTTARLDQLHHRQWTIEHGAPADVWALDQGPDGYLWLGTGAGLYRFDGSEFERIEPEEGDRFPSIDITALYAAPSGDIWLGYSPGGISRLRHGVLENFEVDNSAATWMVLRIVEDQKGTVWAATDRGLMRFDGSAWEIVGEAWNYTGQSATWVDTTHDGTLWVADGAGIAYLEPGATQFKALPVRAGRAVFAEGPDGTLWVLDSYHGLFAISVTRRELLHEQRDATPAKRFDPNYIMVDKDGAVWGSDLTRGGIFRIANPSDAHGAGPDAFLSAAETFTLADGLSSNIAVPLLEDGEGQVWAGTNLGLDSLSRQFFVTEPRVPATSRYGYSALFSPHGDYILDSTTLYRLSPDRDITTVAAMPPQLTNGMVDSEGTVWVGTRQGLWRYTSGPAFTPVDLPEGAASLRVGPLAEDREGNIWVIIRRLGVFRLVGGRWDRVSLPPEVLDAIPNSLFADPEGTIWLGLRDGRLLMIDGVKRQLFDAPAGLDIGEVLGVYNVAGHLHAVGAFGIARLEGGRFRTLSSKQIAAANGVTGLARTEDGQVWMNTISGVVRLSEEELDRAFKDPGYRPALELFTARDGLPGVAQQSTLQTVNLSADGRIWFITNHGLAWHDLSYEVVTASRTPVRLKSLSANGTVLEPTDGMTLPANTTRLSLSYQALNLVSPDRTQFRYMLGGADERWVEVDTARVIQFSNLKPGDYTIRIEASSEPGTWLGPTTELTFRIPPTFMQSPWFVLTCGAVLLCLGFIAYLYHLRQVAERIKTRMEERLNERERIARELHDTLLQGFQGLVLRFQSVLDKLPSGSENRDALEAALERADDVLQEGRDKVRRLRSGSDPVNLIAVLKAIVANILDDQLPWHIETEGVPRSVYAQVAEEIAPFCGEAAANALQHAHASELRLHINFGKLRLEISVIDDGIGMPADVMAKGSLDGHYGLIGLRERACKLGGDMDITNNRPSGTAVCLRLPAKTAYTRHGE